MNKPKNYQILEIAKYLIIFYAPAGTRTPDTRLKRAVLYLLSYWGMLIITGTAGLEPTMAESKSDVLPLTPRPKI